jgi:phage gpG-like protein
MSLRKKYDISEFVKQIDNLSYAYKRIPTKVASICVNFSKERFLEANWYDTTPVKWAELKNKRKSKSGKPRASQRPLTDTGRLKRSIRKIYADEHIVIVGSDVPYAKLQNEGGTINRTVAVKAHVRGAHTRKISGRRSHVGTSYVKSYSRKMNTTIPARQFLGESAKLTELIKEYIQGEITGAITN